jgi:hypothetical protein
MCGLERNEIPNKKKDMNLNAIEEGVEIEPKLEELEEAVTVSVS